MTKNLDLKNHSKTKTNPTHNKNVHSSKNMSNSILNGIDFSNASLQFPKSAFLKKHDDESQINTVELQDQSINNRGIGPSDHFKTTGFALRSNNSIVPASELEPASSPTQELTNDQTFLLNDPDLDFPEGGLQAYLVVFGSFMGLIPAFGLVNSVGAIEAYVSGHQLADVSASTISWIFSIYTFIAFSSGIFSGAFFDRNGAFPPILLGTILFCGGLFATGSATTVYQFILSLGIVAGVGNGLLMSPLVGVVSHYFNKKRGTASSIATTGGSVGGMIMPLLLRKLYPTVGFPWAMRILSFVCLFCLICALLFAKERLKPEHEKITSPKKILKTYIIDVFDYKSFTEWRFVFCSFGVALAECSLVVSSLYFPSYVIKRGYSSSTAYLLITLMNTTGIFGRYIPGYISDKWLGRFNVVILTLAACALVSLALWLPFGYNLKVLYAYAAIYGFCSGSILSLSPVCMGQISKTEEFGKRYSTMYMFVSFAMLVTIPVGGVIIDDANISNYNNFILYTSLLAVGGVVSYIVSRYFCVGLRLCKF